MPDRRSHRGPHGDDAVLFAPAKWPQLRAAVADLSWLLSRGYASPSALKIVGDRYALDARQRMAVQRASCPDEAITLRASKRVDLDHAANQSLLLLDGYNVLTTVEAALGGGVILGCRDGTFRDVASMHGTYHKVEETVPALTRIGHAIRALKIDRARWLLDSPVANSGRLKGGMREVAVEHGWDWEIELVPSPDAALIASGELVATADSAILDRCAHWINLARIIVTGSVPTANIVDLAPT